MESLFKSIPNRLMQADFLEHCQALCLDINEFLVAKGKNPAKIDCLARFLSKTDLAREYIDLAGSEGLTPILIDGYVDDNWLAGYWGWVQDGGAVRDLRKLDLDAPNSAQVMRDLITNGIPYLHKRTGLTPCPEAFEIAIDLSRHVMSAATQEEVDNTVSNEVYFAKMSVVELGKFLGTRHYRKGMRVQGFEAEEAEVIAGFDHEFFTPNYFSEGELSYTEDRDHLASIVDTENEDFSYSLGSLHSLEDVYKRTLASDIDTYGKLARVRMTGWALQPVLGTHLYDLIKEGKEADVWRVALGRATLMSAYFPTRRVADEFVSASIALMLVEGVERDLGIYLLDAKKRDGIRRFLGDEWCALPEIEREVVMTVLATVSRYSELPIAGPIGQIMDHIRLFDELISAPKGSEKQAHILNLFMNEALKGDEACQLWPLLISHSFELTENTGLHALLPHLSVAWYWGKTNFFVSRSTPLYEDGMLASEGWMATLARNHKATAEAVSIANRLGILDQTYTNKLQITGSVLKEIKFTLPRGLAEQAISTDLGL